MSPDGRLLIAPFGSSVVLWNVRDGSRKKLCGGLQWFMSVSFSPDGRYVAAGHFMGGLWIWDARTAQLITKCEIGGIHVVFTPDGNGIAVGDTLWDFNSIRQRKMDIPSQFNTISKFNFSRLEVCFFFPFQSRY
jgi:WD40 repeat protein